MILFALFFLTGHVTAQRQCGPNENYYRTCGTSCEPKCSDTGPCVRVCVPDVCQCANGYKRNDDGNCVPEDQCCPANQFYTRCGTECQPSCETPRPVGCSDRCIIGCQCKEGFLLDSRGNCVRAKDCPSNQCRGYEVLKTCGTACEPTCDDRNPSCTDNCVSGCRCIDGYIRGPDGNCIKEEQCGEKCGENQVYQRCRYTCEQSCSGTPTFCPNELLTTFFRLTSATSNQLSTLLDGTSLCVPGCQCIEGYVRDASGRCINQNQCPVQQCPQYQVYKSCGTACEPSCDDPNDRDCTQQCVRGCQCINGYVRDSLRNCVKPEQCLASQCPRNQVYKTCGTACEPSCDEPGDRPCTRQCVPGCQCIDGYVRDNSKNCVKPELCPIQQCPRYQVYKTCGTACEPTCSEPKGRVCTRQCVRGCQCIDGYVRDSSQNCVKPEQCPPTTICRLPNEVYRTCGTACEPSCSDPWPSRCTEQCIRGCQCIDGHFRDDSGICVKLLECQKYTDPQCSNTEVFMECGNPCEPTCEEPTKLPCPFMGCMRGCICKSGLLRNSLGACVAASDCQVNICPANQVYKSCGTACEQTCEEPGDRVCTEQCVRGCQCKEGYIRDSSRNCVKPEQCPPTTCRAANEVYKTCGTACEATCENRNPTCTDNCVRGCRCIDGYIRGPDKNCIRADQCGDQNCGQNQLYHRCKNICEPSCAGTPTICTGNLLATFSAPNGGGTTNALSSLLEGTGLCQPGCQCSSGYVRDADDNCINPNLCPIQQCPRYQVYKSCGTACEPNCAEPNSRVCNRRCVPGCQCINGYVRDEGGKCVKPEQCQDTQCPRYQVYRTCGTECEPTCAEPKGRVCTRQCVRGCQCIDGYVRDSSRNCVKPEQCSNTTMCRLPKEIYKSCGTACEPTCENPRPRCTEQCVRGCQCIDGYYRDKNGMCVRLSDCPTETQCSDTQLFMECGNPCEPTCAEPEKRPCQGCARGCRCKAGFFRNSLGDCVRSSECQLGVCPTNQIYKTCGTACEPSCDNPSPDVCTDNCVVGCQCKEGYLRNDRSECVRPGQCTSNGCGINEFYTDCGTACPRTCADPRPRTCDAACVPGCQCVSGFLRNGAGVCVRQEDCFNQCPANEVYKSCGTACEPSCAQPTPQGCTTDCVQGCQCLDGYIRHADGGCVKPDQCTPNSCGDNEIYKPCEKSCEPQCKDTTPRSCNGPCVPGCVCKNGYVRHDNGACVHPLLCDRQMTCQSNEVFLECGSCEKTCAEPEPQNCPSGCYMGCQCKAGLLRDYNGNCIAAADCKKEEEAVTDEPPTGLMGALQAMLKAISGLFGFSSFRSMSSSKPLSPPKPLDSFKPPSPLKTLNSLKEQSPLKTVTSFKPLSHIKPLDFFQGIVPQ